MKDEGGVPLELKERLLAGLGEESVSNPDTRKSDDRKQIRITLLKKLFFIIGIIYIFLKHCFHIFKKVNGVTNF